MENLKLEKKIKVAGKIRLLSGMHIGGSSIGLDIGGADKVVIRNPVDNRPYIPGSSLKGKLRSLTEKANNLVTVTPSDGGFLGSICTEQKQDAVQLFGFAADSKNPVEENSAPTRLIVRDSVLTEDSFKKLENSDYTDMYLTEVKTETSIDRLTSAANPRSFERVPAGAEFEFEFIVDIYNWDKGEREKKFMKILSNAMKLLELDYIGGQGSRGYGRIKFSDVKVSAFSAADMKEKEEPEHKDFFKF